MPAVTEAAPAEALKTVVDPPHRPRVSSAGGRSATWHRGGVTTSRRRLGYRGSQCAGAAPKALVRRGAHAARADNVSANVIHAHHRTPCSARAAAAQREEHRRRRLRQGRRGQEHDERQPGAGAGRRGRQRGHLLDADIYGPSQPMMMGIEGRPEPATARPWSRWRTTA